MEAPKIRKARKSAEVVSIIDPVETVKKHVHYYKLKAGFNPNLRGSVKTNLGELFKAVINDNANKSNPARFLNHDGKIYCIQGLTVRDAQLLAYGTLCTIRTEDFPSFFNMRDDSTRDLEANEYEGIVDLSHFIISYKTNIPTIALEYNTSGGRIQDLTRYLQHIGDNHNVTQGVGFDFLMYDELSRIKNRIGRVSKMTAKVHRSMIPQIKQMDDNLATALGAVEKQYQSDDITLILKFDYKQKSDTKSVRETLVSIIDQLVDNQEKTENFLQLKVEAEDKERNNIIQAFDLLADKVRSTIKVEKRKKSRTIISNSMFNIMIEEMDKMNL